MLAVHESGSGTNAKSSDVRFVALVGHKRTYRGHRGTDAIDPTRTLAVLPPD